MMNVNNNARPLQHIPPAQEVELPHVAIQIEPDAEPPAAQENAPPPPANVIPNQGRGWIDRIARLTSYGDYLHGAAAAQLGGSLISLLAHPPHDENSVSSFFSPSVKGLALGSIATFALGLALSTRRPREDRGDPDAAAVALANIAQRRGLRNMELAGRPINDVVREVRGLRAGPSSSASTSFDWTQPGLFVDRHGVDLTADVSHLLNRILQLSLKDGEGNISSARVGLFNNLLDNLENDPDNRTGLANQVLQINATCIDRATAGFNILMRQIGTHGRENMSNKDFLLHVIRDAVFAEADKELLTHLKENRVTRRGKEPVSEAYQAIYGLVAKKLGKIIPDLPPTAEKLRYKNSAGLSDEEMNKIANAVVEKFSDPMKIVQTLYEFPKQKEAMESRFKEELQKIDVEYDAKLDEAYEEFTKSENREPDLEEMAELAKNMAPQLEEDKKKYYAQLIADTALFKNSMGSASADSTAA